MEVNLKELNKFLGRASVATYAGGGPEMDPTEPGFKDLEYKEGNWRYKDSYTGFFQSWGIETVWFKEKPLWTQVYGGGMEKKYHKNEKFARETFSFLKKALSEGEKQKSFQPRGPKKFSNRDWGYSCKVSGNIERFQGREEIKYKKKIVFLHIFVGGLVVSQK